jgi:hypothetical protein
MKIIKVKKNEDGNITDIMLEDGKVYPLNRAILMAKDGEIEGVNIGRGKNGGEFIGADPNENQVDNLSRLPTFK